MKNRIVMLENADVTFMVHPFWFAPSMGALDFYNPNWVFALWNGAWHLAGPHCFANEAHYIDNQWPPTEMGVKGGFSVC